MKQPDNKPRADELSAFVDGELDDVARHRILQQLADNPDAAAEVDELRRFDRLFEQCPPAEPSEEAWDALLGRIETGIANPPAPIRRWRAWLASIVATAAAALAVVFLTPPKPVEPIRQAEPPYEVAASNDVEIISVDTADLAALVVGEPPLREPLVLAALNEVDVKDVGPDADGEWPRVPVFEEFSAPMIMAPAKKP
jgi:anti-sigma factor RsiW